MQLHAMTFQNGEHRIRDFSNQAHDVEGGHVERCRITIRQRSSDGETRRIRSRYILRPSIDPGTTDLIPIQCFCAILLLNDGPSI